MSVSYFEISLGSWGLGGAKCSILCELHLQDKIAKGIMKRMGFKMSEKKSKTDATGECKWVTIEQRCFRRRQKNLKLQLTDGGSGALNKTSVNVPGCTFMRATICPLLFVASVWNNCASLKSGSSLVVVTSLCCVSFQRDCDCFIDKETATLDSALAQLPRRNCPPAVRFTVEHWMSAFPTPTTPVRVL